MPAPRPPGSDECIANNHGLAAAVFAELQWQGRIVAVEADRFVVRSDRAPSYTALSLAEEALEDRRPMKLKTCISKMPTKALRTALLHELVDLGALSEESERYFLILRRTRWRSQPGSPEETLIEHLRSHVAAATAATPPGREDILLSLLRGTGLLETVWTEAELERLKPAIDARTARAPIGRTVREMIIATQAAIVAAVS